MDSRIIKALRAMGLSDEKVNELAALVDRLKVRVHSEQMITRDEPKKPKTIRITYAGKGSTDYAGTAGRTLARMTKKRAVPPPVIGAPQDAPATVPGPPESAPEWQKNEAAAGRRFRLAGVYSRLESTLAALDRSRIHKR